MECRIAFKDVDPSEAVEEEIMAQVQRLERIFPQAMSCRVVVARPCAHGRGGYTANIQLTIPAAQL